MAPGLFGKVPTQGDFLRVNAAAPIVQELDVFLGEGIELLTRVGGALPAPPTYFVFRGEKTREVLVGALAPSQDSVGRVFPLVVFTPVAAADVAQRFAEIPVVYSAFLEECCGILEAAPYVPGPQLAERVRALGEPGSREYAYGREICRRVGYTPAREVQAQIFGDPVHGQQYYGFQAFLSACGPLRGREPAGKAGITLDCPVAIDVHLWTWLELANRMLRWQGGPPSYFWSEKGYPRLLLALGPAPGALLTYLARPDQPSQKLWPLRTSSVEAVEHAKRNLASRYRSVIDGANFTIDAFLAAIAQ